MKKAVILTAVMAFAMMLCFGVQNAMADAVLFPYFTSGGGDLTFIQIINTKESDTSYGADDETLHYTYVYNTDEEICEHFDDNGDTSENDILFYEVTDALAPGHAGQLLPGDTTSTSPALTVSPAWGYLVIDNGNWGSSDDEGTLQGQEIVVNTDDLYAYTLNGINDPGEDGDTNYPRDFYENASDHYWLSWLPVDYASTVFYLFQIEDSDEDIADPDPNTYGIDDCTDLSYCHFEIGDNHNGDADGIYNNNESLKSGNPFVYPGCIYEDDPEDAITGIPGWQSNDFFFSLEELLTGAQYNAVKGTGGWFQGYWSNYGYVYKIVSSSIFGKTMTNMVFEPMSHGEYQYSYTK